MKRSITFKVVTSLLVTIMASIMLIQSLFFVNSRQVIVQRLDRSAAQKIERLSHSLEYPLWNMNAAEVGRAVSLEMGDDNVDAILVRNYDGELLLGRIRDSRGELRPYVHDQVNDQRFKRNFLVLERPIIRDGETIGSVLISMSDLDLRLQLWRLSRFFLAQAALLALVLILTSFYSLKRLILRPLIALKEASGRLGTADFSLNALGDSDDEIGSLAAVLHQTAGELNANIRKQQELYGEVQAVNQTLKQSEEKYRTIFDVANDGIVLFDLLQGRTIEINRQMRALLGRPLGDPADLGLNDILPCGDCDLPTTLAKTLNQGQQRLEVLLEPPTAPAFHAELNLRRAVIDGVECLLLVVRDISDRIRASAALHENERMLATLLSNLPGMVFRCQYTSDWPMLFVSEGSYDLTGYRPEDLIRGRAVNYVDLIHPDDRELIWNQILEALPRHQPYELSYRIHAADGRLRWVWEKGRGVYGEQGEVLFLEGFVSDITELKEKDQQLVQAQKMEAIGTLAGGIAHDFNNILTAIIGYSELLKAQLAKGCPEFAHADQIFQAGCRAKDLTQQILTFSRQVEHHLEEVHVFLIAKETLKLLKASLPATISLRQNIENYSGAVLADPTQIHQIIMNLCTNAYHAMGEDGGELRLELKTYEVDERFAQTHPPLKPGAHLRLSVSDTGAGMDEATQARIFEPFFTTKQQGKGTGLGLAIVHGVVTGLGGAISVQSQLGRGTTFEVYLPKTKAASEPLEAAAGDVPVGAGERILVVDDDQALLKMTSLMLTKLNYRVTACARAVEALELFTAEPDSFELVLTDQIMPGMTGAQLAVNLMAIRPSIPIIIATGFSEKITPESARELGLRSFLQKPFTRQQLGGAIHAELNDSLNGQA